MKQNPKTLLAAAAFAGLLAGCAAPSSSKTGATCHAKHAEKSQCGGKNGCSSKSVCAAKGNCASKGSCGAH